MRNIRKDKEKLEPCLEGIREFCDADCPYRKVMTFLSRKHTFGILRMLARDKIARFNVIEREMKASPKTITNRLNELVKEGIVAREAFAEIPPRVEYSLTEMGNDLKPIIDHLRE